MISSIAKANCLNKKLSVVSWRMYEKEITDYFFAYAVCEKPEPVTYCVSYSIRASMICHSLTTRCYAAQTVARWQKLAQISLRKPCNGHGVSVFRYPASKNILRLFLSYTLRKETASQPANVRKKFCESTLSASR